jgi:hypothetical protein
MTTVKDINYSLSYLTTEAYLAGIDDGMPLSFTPGNKTQGNAPRIEKADGTVPNYIPVFRVGESNKSVEIQLCAVSNVFLAFRKARQEGKKPLV